MEQVYTSIHNLNLISALKSTIAHWFSLDLWASVPLSIGFQRQGLRFRSAILLREHTQTHLLYQDLWAQIQQSLQETSSSPDKSWCFQLCYTDDHWLEFSLDPASLALWLGACQCHLNKQSVGAITLFAQEPELSFRWQYLKQRCDNLLELAATLDSHYQPEWQFQGHYLPSWEQALLDATARYLLAWLNNDKKGDRHCRTLEKNFWTFHRHCAFFSFFPTQPERFRHYGAWFALLRAIAG